MARIQKSGKSDWPEQSQVLDFGVLTSETSIRAALAPPPPPGGLLAPYCPPGEQAPTDNLEKFLAKVRGHEIYKKLDADENFAKARLQLLKKAKRKIPGKYAEPLAEIRLFGIVAVVVGTHANHPIIRPRLPTKATKKAALSLATELLESMDRGIRLDDFLADANLRSSLQHLLRHLTFELSQPVGVRKRKQREDGLYVQRYYMDGLIKLLRSAFDEASPTIIAAVAAMMDFYPDSSTIDRRVTAVAQQEARAEARRLAVAADRR